MGDAFAGSGAMPPGMIPADGTWAAVCEVPAMTCRNPWIFNDSMKQMEQMEYVYIIYI